MDHRQDHERAPRSPRDVATVGDEPIAAEFVRAGPRRLNVFFNQPVDQSYRLELKGELVFKTVAYHRAADAIGRSPVDVVSAYRSGKPPEIPGVGKAINDKILELGTVMTFLGGLAKLLFVFDLAEKEETCPFKPVVRPELIAAA